MLVRDERVAAALWAVLAHTGTISIASYSADWNHYTWWSQATFTTYALMAILGLDSYYFWFFESLQIQVITAVALMSYTNCDVSQSRAVLQKISVLISISFLGV